MKPTTPAIPAPMTAVGRAAPPVEVSELLPPAAPAELEGDPAVVLAPAPVLVEAADEPPGTDATVERPPTPVVPLAPVVPLPPAIPPVVPLTAPAPVGIVMFAEFVGMPLLAVGVAPTAGMPRRYVWTSVGRAVNQLGAPDAENCAAISEETAAGLVAATPSNDGGSAVRSTFKTEVLTRCQCL